MNVKLWDIKKNTWIFKKDIACVTTNPHSNTFKLNNIVYDKIRYELNYIFEDE